MKLGRTRGGEYRQGIGVFYGKTKKGSRELGTRKTSNRGEPLKRVKGLWRKK